MCIRNICLTVGIAALAIQAIPAGVGLAETVSIAALEKKVTIRRDSDGVSHITAKNAHDLFVAQGWQHAADRLFQMDVLRRQASGTLAELLGPAALAQDVELRTIGLRRAAERSLDAVSMETRRALEAYAEGVNAYIVAQAPPPEYAALELTQVAPWTPVDSLAVAKLLSFSLSFDLDINATIAFETYRAAGTVAGFDGAALYFEDTHRSAPFDPAATVPDALIEPVAAVGASVELMAESTSPISRRERLLDAALELFAERGVDATPVPSIARAAGVGTGTLYRYFPSKEALANEVYRRCRRKLVTSA